MPSAWSSSRSAALAVFELFEQDLGERARPFEIGSGELGLHEFQQRVEQECIIVKIRVEVRFAVLAGREQPLTRSRAFVIRPP